MSAVYDTMPHRVDLQIATGKHRVPDDADWEAWVHAALAAGQSAASGAVAGNHKNAKSSSLANTRGSKKASNKNLKDESG